MDLNELGELCFTQYLIGEIQTRMESVHFFFRDNSIELRRKICVNTSFRPFQECNHDANSLFETKRKSVQKP